MNAVYTWALPLNTLEPSDYLKTYRFPLGSKTPPLGSYIPKNVRSSDDFYILVRARDVKTAWKRFEVIMRRERPIDWTRHPFFSKALGEPITKEGT